MMFSEGSISAKILQKQIKIQFFYRIFINNLKTFSKFSQAIAF